jgi:hypothetical protein
MAVVEEERESFNFFEVVYMLTTDSSSFDLAQDNSE